MLVYSSPQCLTDLPLNGMNVISFTSELKYSDYQPLNLDRFLLIMNKLIWGEFYLFNTDRFPSINMYETLYE